MASLRHRFDVLDVVVPPGAATLFANRIGKVIGTPVHLAAMDNMLHQTGWLTTRDSDDVLHLRGYADCDGSRVRDALRTLEGFGDLLHGRLLYQDVRALLLECEFGFGTRPRVRRLGRAEYEALLDTPKARRSRVA